MSVRSAMMAAGVSPAIAKREAPWAERAMMEAGITTQKRARHFLAQVLHESGRLRYFEELASGEAYEGRLDLGNTRRGDGRRYKGRGPIQLTGRNNYRNAGRALGLNLELTPNLAAQHAVGWRVAGWFWSSHGLNGLADTDDIEAVTRRINGGLNGLTDRRTLLRSVSLEDCRPSRLAGYREDEVRWIREFDALRGKSGAADRRAVLRVVMTKRRKAIWRVAQKPGGWDRANRRARYRSLVARTRP